MKSFYDYVKEHGNDVIFEFLVWNGNGYNGVELEAKLTGKDEFLLLEEGKIIHVIEDDYDLIDYIEEKYKAEIRICDYCGGVMQSGMTDDEADFYNHVECFDKDMDERYGKGNWRNIPEDENGEVNENWLGGFYEYREDENSEWEPEPSYYTEWY